MSSIVTQLGKTIKFLTGIDDISLTLKKWHKHIGMLLYHQKYTSDDIVNVMKQLGMKEGSVVCIHAAMREFYNYQGNAEELIKKILDTITDSGTLLMPAFPSYENQRDENFIFDLAETKTAAGFLAETFRKQPGVLRSINTRHSVCAIGKYAKELTDGHERCINCWDENSPWYKMTRLNALVFNLGMSDNYIGTFDHCVEGILYKEHPYWKQFFNLKRKFRYRDNQGQTKEYESLDGNIECRTHEQTLIKHFDETMHRKAKLSNLKINVYETRPCIDKMIELGRKGITMYYVPSTAKYKF